jgi:hypothetical protein
VGGEKRGEREGQPGDSGERVNRTRLYARGGADHHSTSICDNRLVIEITGRQI